jgi:LmbE family N-acetylglucosaminyl deacetylase
MKMKPYRLLVVAHPDDETIFFGGLLQRERSLPWKVICVTDGNFENRGEDRKKEFLAATKLLGVKQTEHWNFPDRFPDRLSVEEITAQLRDLEKPKEIYTHGPFGEYGHPHHQDVCLATHLAFPKLKIFSPAWNCQADKVIKLSQTEYKKKTKAYEEIYFKETSRFLNMVPNTAVETFSHFTLAEVKTIVRFLRKEEELKPGTMKKFSWLEDQLPSLRDRWAVKLF